MWLVAIGLFLSMNRISLWHDTVQKKMLTGPINQCKYRLIPIGEYSDSPEFYAKPDAYRQKKRSSRLGSTNRDTTFQGYKNNPFI